MKPEDDKDQSESVNRYRRPYRAGADLQREDALRYLTQRLL